jgi:hypothetical protein
MTDELKESDKPLPATLIFVLTLGGVIFVGWFAMFALLHKEW